MHFCDAGNVLCLKYGDGSTGVEHCKNSLTCGIKMGVNYTLIFKNVSAVRPHSLSPLLAQTMES